jgi:type IV pilus assembly protein PilQ
MPQVTADGGVIMTVDVNRDYAGPIIDLKTQASSINSRSAKTKVLVKNGQTAVIGGIYQSDATDSEVGIPWLRQIPVVGALFKTNASTKDKIELLIFLTPQILGQLDSHARGGEGSSPQGDIK